MHVLLLNQNATIERLAKLSSGKLGYELTNAKDISEVENASYAFVIVDSDLYGDAEFGILKDKFPNAKYILIIAKGAERPDGFDVYIEKPFLPTELVDIFTSLASTITVSEDDIFGDSTMDSFGDDVFGSDDTNELSSLDDIASDTTSDNAFDDSGLDELDSHEFSFDTITDDIKSSLEDETQDDMGDIDLGTQPDYEEITLDPNDDATLESFGGIDELSLDTPLVEEEATHEDDIADEISLEDYQQNLTLDEAPAEAVHDDLDFGDDFHLDGDASIDEDDGADIVISNDEHEVFDTIEGEKAVNNMEEMPDILDDVEEMAANESQIFDEDEVNKLKDLLDETEEEKLENEDFDLDDIKIQNDELGSLTEESLAEALGVGIDGENDLDMDINEGMDAHDELPEIEDDEIGAPISMPANDTPTSAPAASSRAIELNPNQSITISLDAIKELLESADVTINITLSKKQ